MFDDDKNQPDKKSLIGRIWANPLGRALTVILAVTLWIYGPTLVQQIRASDQPAVSHSQARSEAANRRAVQSPNTLDALEDRLRAHDSSIKLLQIYAADGQVVVTFDDGQQTTIGIATAKQIDELDALAHQAGLHPTYGQTQEATGFLRVLLGWLPMLLLVGVWVLFMRSQQAGAGRTMGLGKSKARLLSETAGRVTFADVAGIDEAKGELQEIVEFLKDPGKFQRLGGKIPKGVLLVGPPGTGKTLLARAIAGEAKVPFFTIAGSDFVEMFVGVGASRVRDMFEQGKRSAPCIIFIDEIDAVGRHRGSGMGGGNDEREQTLNQMLVEMDGFEANEGVILIAATNRPDVLDSALLRPGRFDRQVVVPNPDVNGREKILEVHMRKVPLESDVDRKVIARGTPGFSGADLKNLVNEGALLAAKENARKVAMRHFEAAKDKVMMGTERRSLVMSEAEKRMTAYHEAGHALCAVSEPECDPVHKATIVPRGRALGLVLSLPVGDTYSSAKSKLLAQLVMAMGGRAAEELTFGPDKVSNGAGQDIKMATSIASQMITEWGMSDKLGMVCLAEQDDARSSSLRRIHSESTAQAIDAEIKAFIDTAYAQAKIHLSTQDAALKRLAEALLEHETLDGNEVRDVIADKPIRQPMAPDAVTDASPLA